MHFGRTRLPAALPALLAFTILSLHAQQKTGTSIDVPAGAHAILQARGEGVQIYTCTLVDGSFRWILKAPDARLLDASGHVIGRHFAGPTWKLDDGGEVTGLLMAGQASPDANSVPWLLLRAKPGSATGRLADVTFIRRTETHGGAAPASGCTSGAPVDSTVKIPYTATYTFYSGK